MQNTEEPGPHRPSLRKFHVGSSYTYTSVTKTVWLQAHSCRSHQQYLPAKEKVKHTDIERANRNSIGVG